MLVVLLKGKTDFEAFLWLPATALFWFD